MATRHVNFEIGPSHGDYICKPTVLHAKPGDTIEFFANKFPFTVLFKRLSPLIRTDIRSDGKPARVPVRKDAQNGVYPYACAIFNLETKKIYMDASCPPIIIDPGFRG